MLSYTGDESVDAWLEWLAEYRLRDATNGEFLEGAIEGLCAAAILAMKHPEYLQALVQRACSAFDRDLDGLPAGHTWLEHCDMIDMMVAEVPM